MSKRPEEPPREQPEDNGSSASEAALAAEVEVLRLELKVMEEERIRAIAREAHLRAELQHRVRNMLAIVRSISARTFGTNDEDENANHFRGRLDALARIEVRCGDSSRKNGCDLEDMVSDELRIFEFDERIEIKGPEVSVPHEIARLIALAIHELATNSIKFGALSSTDARARLSVRWTFARSRLRFIWEEIGVPIIGAAPASTGFGQEYIEQALPYQINAATLFELRPGGIFCTMEVPFPEKPEADIWPRAWA